MALLPIPGKLQIKNADDRTVLIEGYTGAAVDASDYGFPHPIVYDIENFTVANHIPYSLEHRDEQMGGDLLGHTVESKIHNGRMTNIAKHAVDSETSNRVLKELQAGDHYEASMDAEFRYKDIQFIESGSVEINNRMFQGPIFVATKGKVTEITATKSGRDSDTRITKLSNHYEEGRDLLMKVKNSKTTPPTEGTSPPQKEEGEAKFDQGYLLDFIDDADAKALIPNARKEKWDENKFKDELLKVKNAKEEPKEGPSFDYLFDYVGNKDAVTLIPNARKNGWDEEKFKGELEILKLKNNMPDLPNIHSVKKEGGETVMALRMAKAIGVPDDILVKNTNEKLVEEAGKDGPLYIREAMTISCNANGGRFTGHSDVEGLCKHMKRLVVQNAFSTVNFPNLMHHVSMWKKEELWEIDKPESLQFCKAESSKDFRKQGHLKPRGGKMWEGFNKEGKITHFTAGKEDTYETELDTKAQIVTFNRQTVINDDMGWINDALTLMLEGAIMLPDYMFINLLYEASNQGVVNTSGANQNWFTLALNATNLTTVYEAVRRRYTAKDSADGDKQVNGTYNTRWTLVHTSALEQTAWDLIKQDRIVGDTTANTKTGDKNYWYNKFDLSLMNNLDNTTYHASADTDVWCILPQRETYRPFYVRYLNNQRSPVTEIVDLPADELGFGVRGYWDINMGYRTVEDSKLQSFAFSNPA